VVHRDVKPDNIFVDRRDRRHPMVKLLDFGVMAALSGDRRTATRGFAGTHTHAAPEQIPRADPDSGD